MKKNHIRNYSNFKIHVNMIYTLGISEYPDPDYSFSYGIKKDVAEFRFVFSFIDISLYCIMLYTIIFFIMLNP